MDLEDVMLGEIRIFPYDFAPTGWLPCDGRLIPLSSNSALFSIIGHQYGGDGKTNFGLPDLRGVAPMGSGASTELGTTIAQGQRLGRATATIGADQLPQHSHALQRKGATALNQKTSSVGANSNLGQLAVRYDGTNMDLVPHFAANTPPNVVMHPASIAPQNGGQIPHENRQPFLALGYFISTRGLYPSFV
jgi:microcystin-dependent protein